MCYRLRTRGRMRRIDCLVPGHALNCHGNLASAAIHTEALVRMDRANREGFPCNANAVRTHDQAPGRDVAHRRICARSQCENCRQRQLRTPTSKLIEHVMPSVWGDCEQLSYGGPADAASCRIRVTSDCSSGSAWAHRSATAAAYLRAVDLSPTRSAISARSAIARPMAAAPPKSCSEPSVDMASSA